MTQRCFRGKRNLDNERHAGEIASAVVRAKQGDPAAIRMLYLRYADNVYGYARSIVRNEHDAEDIVQQVFTRMLTAIRTYEQRSVPFTAWLLRITHNMAIDHIRRRGRDCSAPEEWSGETEDHGGENHLRDGALRCARRALPGSARDRPPATPGWFLSGRDRGTPRPIRGLDPRLASPWSPRAAGVTCQCGRDAVDDGRLAGVEWPHS